MTQDLNAKLQQQMEAVSSKMDAILKKFNATAESMLGKSSQQDSSVDASGYVAMCKENASLKNEIVGLQQLVIELYQWSIKPDCMAPPNLEVWTKVVTLVTYWKHIEDRKTEEGTTNNV